MSLARHGCRTGHRRCPGRQPRWSRPGAHTTPRDGAVSAQAAGPLVVQEPDSVIVREDIRAHGRQGLPILAARPTSVPNLVLGPAADPTLPSSQANTACRDCPPCSRPTTPTTRCPRRTVCAMTPPLPGSATSATAQPPAAGVGGRVQLATPTGALLDPGRRNGPHQHRAPQAASFRQPRGLRGHPGSQQT